MVPQDVRRSGQLIVLAEGLIVQQPGGHSPAAHLKKCSLRAQNSLALIHHSGELYLPALQRLEQGPLLRPDLIVSIPNAPQAEAVAGDAGGVLKAPGHRGGQDGRHPLCRYHITGQMIRTFSPTRIRFGFRICGFLAASSSRDRPYCRAMDQKVSPCLTRW